MIFLSLNFIQASSGIEKEFSIETFKFGKESIQFRRKNRTRIWISEKCYNSSLKNCLALEAEEKVRKLNCPKIDIFSASPGANLCDKLSGTSKIGQDNNRNEINFCKFSDGSYISTGFFINKCKTP